MVWGSSTSLELADRALNKNKKPNKKTIRAHNDLVGSFGSPCRFSPARITLGIPPTPFPQ
ncbi:hypothetical protein F3J43_22700 [Pantoea sp. Cy-639]|nr:hypothetical protein [Pantoea sp. Cy-639]